MLFGPDDVYNAIEVDKLGMKLCLSSGYHLTERWTKEALEFKVLLNFLIDGEITEADIHERLKLLAEKEINKQFANEDDIPIYVYLTALREYDEFYDVHTMADQEAYMKGCEIVSQVENLHWARQHVLAWEKQMEQDNTDE